MDEGEKDDADLNWNAGNKRHEGMEFNELQVNGKQERPAQSRGENERDQALAPFDIAIDCNSKGERNRPNKNEPIAVAE